MPFNRALKMNKVTNYTCCIYMVTNTGGNVTRFTFNISIYLYILSLGQIKPFNPSKI